MDNPVKVKIANNGKDNNVNVNVNVYGRTFDDIYIKRHVIFSGNFCPLSRLKIEPDSFTRDLDLEAHINLWVNSLHVYKSSLEIDKANQLDA